MNSRYRANSAQSLPSVSGSVPRPHVKMGGRPVSHATSASSVAVNYRANYQPYGSRSDRHPANRCNPDSDLIRFMIVLAYFMTVTFGAGFLAFWYSSLWIPSLSQMFVNGTYGNERLSVANGSTTIDPFLNGTLNATVASGTMTI